ncbi:UDP-phosphate N-acetylgalactosaminyl-1-phosphate transferase [Laceyella sacchari]|jgi:exopolysaccharide biosynthesis polyprenyl glycosylphosphotransferase|uniref:Exopolysaccharide biosynthesis polyprenyl glycosylphosphotransferase n=2 Tax=Laceyella TaxID=292635 RepID=A0AA46AGF6_9BACL|nr:MULTISPECIES: sugar transferase [Laceyella]AUS10180.1 UDP-phosphate N-acetylgalactosaminyl-1-phosphate transferase [Laceyella sacchari]MRG26587.1 exopolysaccharide biosynthesis polyprenyl glycosylphosphotransferase [Laceyella tengchongensis]PRZ16472.1 exopolysaccharide biosynthesis polyprenyl glycosylphosphotransferase [Laceyella sediminis]SMP26751.1 exopolysaccharide biosynthesis polyprenyl glycosylphosphotransferase [Laceyella tengchongensis]
MSSKVAYESNSRAFSGEMKTPASFYLAFKRGFEIVFSIGLLLFTLPVLILTAIAIKLESPGPIFYKQERVGLNGKTFNIFKLRSMRTDAEKNGPQWAAKNDPRVTRVGQFIRKTRIDELPQLINILRGDMSLIGPRPERPMFTEQFDKEIPGFKKRLMVKPGLTGWAQVNGGYEATPAEKLELDLEYIRNQSFKMDFQILLKTVWIVISGNGAR